MEPNSLPAEVAMFIASKTKVPDICALGSASTFWREVCSSNYVWFSLSKERWPGVEVLTDFVLRKDKKNEEGKGHDYAPTGKEWRDYYILRDRRVMNGVSSLVKFMKQSSNAESIEVVDYGKAMEHLRRSKLRFHDVEMYLLKSNVGVLVNLMGIHYCLSWLGTKSIHLKEALSKNQISDRNVCLRWWVLGQWVNGFRRGDEMHVRITSLIEVLELPLESFLSVIERGILYEVLRVQISADFRSSAWIDRDMHSQR